MGLNDFAKLYEEATFIEARRSVLDILENYAPELRTDMSILDLACGTGTVTRVIHEKCSDKSIKPPKIVGVDLGDGFIQAFQDNKKTYGWETATAHVGDASDLKMCADGEFDLVIMAYGLFAVADEVAGKVTAEIHRVLKPGGKAFFTIWRDNFVTRMLQGASKAVGRPQAEIDRYSMGKWLLPETTRDLLVSGGFATDKVAWSRHDDTFGTNNEATILDRFDTTFWKGAGAAAWTDGQRSQWRTVVEKLIATEQEETGGVQANCWIFVAEK